MNKIILLTSFAILMIGCTAAPPREAEKAVKNEGRVSLPALTPKDVPPPTVTWADEVNFTALREAFGLRSDFVQLCERDYPIKKITNAFDAGNYKDGVEIGDAWLIRCPIDSRVHTLVGCGYHQLGDEATAKTHIKWSAGLIKSILSSGDGKSPNTPYVTISIGEEYAVLRWRDFQPKQQALLKGTPQLDALTVTDEKGNEETLYFNPFLHFVRLNEMVKQINSENFSK